MTDREDAVFGIVLVGIGLVFVGVCLTAAHYLPPILRLAARVIVAFPEWAASATLRQWGALLVKVGVGIFFIGAFLVAAFLDDPAGDSDAAEEIVQTAMDGQADEDDESTPPLGEYNDR